MPPDTDSVNDKSLHAAWDHFDQIHCITLRERQDRRRSAEAAFRRLGILDRVVFHVAERHPENPEQGIFESHQACLRKGLSAGARCIAVFEDDVVVERYCPRRLRRGVDHLAAGREWDLLLFGALVAHARRTSCPSLMQVQYRCLAHAYAVTAPLARRIADSPWRHEPYDAMVRRLASTCYMIYPAFAFQSDAATDNDRLRWLDRCRRACGGLRRIQKVNEWYHRHRWPVIAGHAVAAALLLAWLL